MTPPYVTLKFESSSPRMCYHVPLVLRAVLLLQTSCIGLLAWQQHSHWTLQRELVGLRVELQFLREAELGAGGGGGDQDASPVGIGNPVDRPGFSEGRAAGSQRAVGLQCRHVPCWLGHCIGWSTFDLDYIGIFVQSVHCHTG